MTISDLVRSALRYRGISADSKEVGKGFIFVAVKGTKADGSKFIPQAIQRGAAVIVSSKANKHSIAGQKISFVRVKDTRKALAVLCSAFYGEPSRKIRVVGVTGTNGKTTVTYLIEAILKEAGCVPAVLGTINYRFKGKVIPALNTTPGPQVLQPLFARMHKQGVDYAVMEVSSHALDQERTGGIDFHSAIFTNLTQDHLDYHGNLNNYFLAKAKLFKGLGPRAFAVVNRDDPRADRLMRSCRARVITYGIENKAEVMAKEIDFGMGGTSFLLCMGSKKIPLVSKLIGRHNVYNLLAAAAWALKEGVAPGVISSALKKFRSVPGRLERVDCKKGFSVFVDYAHTEDALKNILNALRHLSSGRIIVVFGCGGERDKTKRPKMGSVVSGLADYAIITNDNPRAEEPMSIIRDIRRGISADNYCVMPERAQAIKRSLKLARAGDIVLVAGKGHEDHQIIKDKLLHFDDREVIRRCLSLMN